MPFHKNKPQFGRSMIEMLGVLAIVGVLSVGGIAGYSKAMTKIHINQAIQQISHIAIGVQTLYKNQKVVDNLKPDVLKKAGIVDINANAGLYSDTTSIGTRLNSPSVGSTMLVFASQVATKDFFIGLYNLSEEACISIAGYDWTMLDGFNYLTTKPALNSSSSVSAYAQPTGSQNRVPLSIDIVSQICSGDSNVIFFYFKLL